MIELRAYVSNLDAVRNTLLELGSVAKGEYVFQDYIYTSLQHEGDYNLNKEFIRIRVYSETQWNQKNVELMHKIKSFQGLSGMAKIKEEFDKFEEAAKTLDGCAKLLFSYKRTGCEYALEGARIFVENVDYLPPSVEIVASSQKEVDTIFEQVRIEKIVYDSVPKLVEQSLEINTKINSK